MQPRTYWHWIEGKDLVTFTVTVKETNLYIRATTNLQRKAHRLVLKYRAQLENYIKQYPVFLTSLEPLPSPRYAPLIVKRMIESGQKAGVGPMAAVAGAIADCVGADLLSLSPELIIENGGDIYLKCLTKRIVGIYAGKSPLTGKIGIEVEARDTPIGICTSSGTVSHSLSFGKADAAVAIAPTATLADAAATAICNRVKQPGDIASAIEFSKNISGLKGVIIIMGENMGVWGEVKLCETSAAPSGQ
ncbi:MAG: thiamine biosynthesis protein ApbE [Chloroflexi bacterium RBG_16_50_9]|nr:MAG: thiamine biosynthesis protein ApbE [Chloroflexi bacterium RBG_16_50_9]